MHIRRYLLAAATASLLGATPASAAPITPDYGAWCWFADPRAVTYNNHPVFGWVDGAGNIMVGDDTGHRYVLDPKLERDDHDNPAFYIRKDGRLTAFWSAHSGPAMRYRTTTGTSISNWGPVKTGPVNPPTGYSAYTYPNPRRVGDTLFLFWSGSNATATYATSPDDGATWTAAANLFDPSKPYVRYIKYRQAGNEIHLAWNLEHPRLFTSGIYHAIIRDGKIWRQDGTQIGELGTPLDPTAGDHVYTLETDGGAWIHDIAVKDGRATIVYATFPTFADHTYRYAQWDGAAWRDERITMAGPSFNETVKEAQYSGGITLNPANPSTVYLSRKIGSQFEIERWTRGDTAWTHQAITRDSTEPNVRPFRVADGLAWMRGAYPSYWGYKTQVEWLPPGQRYTPPVTAPVTPPVTQPRQVTPEPGPAVPAAAAPLPTGPAPGVTSPKPAVMRIVMARWGRGVARVRVRCRGGREDCVGRLVVRVRHGGRVVARGGFRVWSGHARWVHVQLTAGGRRLQRRPPLVARLG